jgi:hypothetical protein
MSDPVRHAVSKLGGTIRLGGSPEAVRTAREQLAEVKLERSIREAITAAPPLTKDARAGFFCLEDSIMTNDRPHAALVQPPGHASDAQRRTWSKSHRETGRDTGSASCPWPCVGALSEYRCATAQGPNPVPVLSIPAPPAATTRRALHHDGRSTTPATIATASTPIRFAAPSRPQCARPASALGALQAA